MTEPLGRYLADPAVIARYQALVSDAVLPTGCRIWLGAISSRGHGRFWLGGGRVMIAHRFGFMLDRHLDELSPTQMVTHLCDEASCQTPAHWILGTGSSNTAEWHTRRALIGNPTRDTRGAAGRARALREAARNNLDLHAAAVLGLPEIDRYQERLL